MREQLEDNRLHRHSSKSSEFMDPTPKRPKPIETAYEELSNVISNIMQLCLKFSNGGSNQNLTEDCTEFQKNAERLLTLVETTSTIDSNLEGWDKVTEISNQCILFNFFSYRQKDLQQESSLKFLLL